MDFHCYSQRLLNPFRGVMNIIEFEAAEAVTLDGIHWDIYVRDAELVKDLPDSRKVQTSDIRYGRWSQGSGLKRGAIYPSNDFRLLEAQGAMVYEYLLQHHQDIPFPLVDVYELWLLDRAGMPLVLVKSCIDEQDMDLDRMPAWCACHEAHDRFSSDAMQTITRADNELSSPADYLTQYMNQLAGNQAQWFRRLPDGSGLGLDGIHLAEPLQQRHLAASAFPFFLINETLHDDDHQDLIRDFLTWQAPLLLLLQHLSPQLRRQLEIKARNRAIEVEKQHRMYPDIIDTSQIKAARVEARLRQSSGRGDAREEDVLSPEYIELLHPSPTE